MSGHTAWEKEHLDTVLGYTDVNAIFPSLKSDAEIAYEHEKPPFRGYRARSIRGWAYSDPRGSDEDVDYRRERD